MPPFLQLIRDLHTGTTARVRTSQGMSDVFYTTSGVRKVRRLKMQFILIGKLDNLHFY